ncbi:MAG: GvpL/GvpF family gas vesicle protein [Dehalococcoidia bacterium]|nr:GvpL/GvpF family gas vesicle protein [Dehalococcoidia bacterium]
MARIYLYGIIEGTEDADLDISGVDGAGPVRIVVGDGLGGVVSDYTGKPVSEMPKEELVRCLLRHQEAIERVMQRYTVLPVKFGTLLGSVDEVRALLTQRRLQLEDALASIRGMVEIDVAATWDTARVLQEIGREEEVSRARKDFSRGGSPTKAQQIQLGQMVKASMDRRRSVYRDRMVALLVPAAVQMLDNALISDQLVMNVAFLVWRAREREFDAAVQRLDGLFGNEITFRMVGPMPPYSFSTVEVTRLTPEQITNARQALGLEGTISVEAVRRAYRSLAAEAQRDLATDSAFAQDTLVRLRQASELLLQCCSPHNGSVPGNGSDTSGRWEGDGLFVVAVKRSDSREIEPARFGGLGGHGQ